MLKKKQFECIETKILMKNIYSACKLTTTLLGCCYAVARVFLVPLTRCYGVARVFLVPLTRCYGVARVLWLFSVRGLIRFTIYKQHRDPVEEVNSACLSSGVEECVVSFCDQR